MSGWIKWLYHDWDLWLGETPSEPLGGDGTYGGPSDNDTYETKDEPYGET